MVKGVFLGSHPSLSDFHKQHPGKRGIQQFILVGRSNVGKSSLINYLFGKIAKTAKKPGKTVMPQFFLTPLGIFIDLPGYGFARVSKTIQSTWNSSILSILEKNVDLSCILFLLDIRHNPSLEDLEMLAWIRKSGLPCFLLFTKSDKLRRQEKEKRETALQKELGIRGIAYSYREKSGAKELLMRLQNGTFA
ncbi:MAG: ribosome biogenesis GTP-binding protein YihA/YsxC [Chlamydiota bacterium]